MKRSLMLFAVLALASTLAHGQSPCAQLGVDCTHPNIQQRRSFPPCDAACRQAAQDWSEEYWKRREEYDRERA